MAEGSTTMFGKAYDTVGSADKNLILQTRGDLKVKWGGKYIDLIKNGKINVDIDFFAKVDSKDSIHKDGLYLIEKDQTQEAWLSIGGTLVNLLGEVGTTYVSFMAVQEVQPEQKLMALTNAGFFYDDMEKVKAANLKSGLVYIINEHQLYYVNEGSIVKYEQNFEIPNPLILGNVTIDGTTSVIQGSGGLYFNIGGDHYISFDATKIDIEREVIIHQDLQSKDYQSKKSGYRLYMDADGSSVLEVDKVVIRKILEYDDILDVTYNDLTELIKNKKLVARKKYRIIDFQNEWEVTSRCYYEDKVTNTSTPIQGDAKNVWPIVVTADTTTTLKKECYFEDNNTWYVEYDVNFHPFIREETVSGKTINIFAKGRITLLRDEKGNEANYDFKHRLFKHTTGSSDQNQWLYTFNIANPVYNTNTDMPFIYSNVHINADASQLNYEIKNNIIRIPEPPTQDITMTIDGNSVQTQKLLDTTEYIIFPDCSTIFPYNNKIQSSEGQYTFTNKFHDNTFISITDCQINATIENCNFGNVSNTTISGVLQKCNFEGLSNMEVGKTSQTIINMTVQEDLTPNSAQWVQVRDNPSTYQECNPLKLNQDDVPRLQETSRKECYIKTITKDGSSKTVFYVQLTSDDNTPSGVILMWYGDVNDIPSGYVICDGNNGTPNLVDRFIKASASNVGPIDNDDTEVVNNVKTNKIKLSADNLPKHTHSITTSNLSVQSASTSVVTSGNNVTINFEQGNTEYTANNYNTNNQDHTHAISGDISCGDGNFANTSFNIEPQAYALIFIMKL